MKCFYHSADLDGHCAGAIVKSEFTDCEMIGINYGDPFPFDSIEPGEIVYMVDFCLQPFSDMIKLNEMCQLNWIDHHKTAIEEAYANGFIASGGQLIEDGKAGCELAWEYVKGEKPTPQTVTLLGRYDVWDHSNEMVLPFQYGMRQEKDTLPKSPIWESLLSIDSEHLCHEIASDGQLILDYEDSQNEEFCRAYSFETVFAECKAVCANRGFTNSKLFDSVYDPEKHDMMITFCWKPKGNCWTVSMYSTKDDVDCGLIAKRHGGGGHKGAAGFQCDELPFLDVA